MAGVGPILVGTERVSGGNLRATYSIKAGVRVHLFVLPEAYTAGTLATARQKVAGWFPPDQTGTIPYESEP